MAARCPPVRLKLWACGWTPEGTFASWTRCEICKMGVRVRKAPLQNSLALCSVGVAICLAAQTSMTSAEGNLQRSDKRLGGPLDGCRDTTIQHVNS